MRVCIDKAQPNIVGDNISAELSSHPLYRKVTISQDQFFFLFGPKQYDKMRLKEQRKLQQLWNASESRRDEDGGTGNAYIIG